VNKQTSKLLYKLGIPVGQMQAGRHYNLAIRLGKQHAAGGREGHHPPAKLYVTLCLASYLADDTARYEALAQQSMTRIHAAMGATNIGFAGSSGGVAGVWKLVGDSSVAEEPPTVASGRGPYFITPFHKTIVSYPCYLRLRTARIVQRTGLRRNGPG
jgi:hypothetical protein